MFLVDESQGLTGITERPRVSGRFLFLGEEKFFIKGVTYGPFPPNEQGEPLPSRERVSEDFRLMREHGINTIRVYWVPPRWLLDVAALHGVFVMVGIPWPQHLCFLDQWEVKEQVKDAVREACRSLSGHPAVLAYFIGNEIPAHIVRWHGASKVEKFLKKLTDIVRAEDPAALVTYANYPSTEYLRLPFLDFLSVNVYLHDEKAFRAYVKKLANIACDIPLVLSEFGMDSMRHGEEAQAETLGWQVKAAFELGCSGTVVFAWTDEWYTGGHLIEDWAFGMVTADRQPKAALRAVTEGYAGSLPPLPPETPMISVVVCAYNAESTMEGCLASFQHVEYPNFEVIVVDDGSTDTTGDISDRFAAKYPYIHVIHQPNLGLSAARNVGLHAARGEIVAYTDSDCYVDAHWLHYMAWAFRDERFVAVGGPNLPPPEDNRTAACVAVSPGAPTHVLITDEIAEHIPGCNMAYRKDVLASINGFDATYRAAGDDVDVCWRLMDEGHVIGFSAAMFVWHHRRCTVDAYFKQQKGYGRAEALLLPKHQHRFNALGNSRWAGRIYGDIGGSLLAARPIIYHGSFGMGLFQTQYEPQGSLAAYLPMSFEWALLAGVMLLLGLVQPLFAAAAGLMLATTVVFTAHRAAQAKLPAAYDSFGSRFLIFALTLTQPLVRGWVRYKTIAQLRFAAKKKVRQAPGVILGLPAESDLPRFGLFRRLKDGLSVLAKKLTFHRYFWNSKGLERPEVIDHLMRTMKALGLTFAADTGFSTRSSSAPWDVEVRPGLFAKLRLRATVEHHGGDKRFVRLAGRIKPTKPALTIMGIGLVTAGVLWTLSHLAAYAALAATVAFSTWVLRDIFHGAHVVSLLTAHLIACKDGSSLSAPGTPEAAKKTGLRLLKKSKAASEKAPEAERAEA